MKYDKIVIGAGIYGLYAALLCGRKNETVLVLECDEASFGRATYINQARVHQGYHYPRSISTALKSAGYFERFNREFEFCINKEFQKIYATSESFSWSNGKQFNKFCNATGIPCEELNPNQFFNIGMCDGAFKVREYTYDATILRTYMLSELSMMPNIKILYNIKLFKIEKLQDKFSVYGYKDNLIQQFDSSYILNATYASVNQVLDLLGFNKFAIKYELCEIILCDANEKLKEYGFTVMDGPFFSIMPFGKTGLHSLTSVTFTPHATCYNSIPGFSCQNPDLNGKCTSLWLGNCNNCLEKPATAYPYMKNLARKYLKDEFEFEYKQSLFSIKPILLSSEIDDSRPTVTCIHSKKPTFISVLSGKINTVFDLEEVLNEE